MNNSTSDLAIRIKNGYAAQKQEIEIQFSKMNLKITEILKREKYIKDAQLKRNGPKQIIAVTLLYQDGQPAVKDVQIVSKPGRRMYSRAKYLKPVIGGFGTAILTTPKGIVTDKEAKKMKVGGEVLFRIW